ncbi:nuclear transport factor 2 family protein [Deinococcus planocerae]|uniref:nuclear transport factor 2 family protein n=1 Tax=Deinococcus planocerae TaxID=1737569 RepID=UPI000C7F6B71|nr:nuclear transport factor 2 family protein [Deinococcus planocerae]
MSDERRDAYRLAMQAGDPEAVARSLAPDVVMHVAVHDQPVVGREAARLVFTLLREVFSDFRFTREFEAGDERGLVFETRVEGIPSEGVNLLRFGEHGLIREFTVMLRPLSALTRLGRFMGPRMARRPGAGSEQS